MTDHIAALADTLRQLRDAHGLSLAQLGERSGVAKATLFKIEQGRTNPTVDTLASIAATFDVPIADLLRTSADRTVEVVRAGTGEVIADDASTSVILRNQVAGAGTMELSEIRFHAERSVVSAGHGAGSREHVLVRSGRISLGLDGEMVELDEGDYATYPTATAHRWQALGGDAVVWVFHMFPAVPGVA